MPLLFQLNIIRNPRPQPHALTRPPEIVHPLIFASLLVILILGLTIRPIFHPHTDPHSRLSSFA